MGNGREWRPFLEKWKTEKMNVEELLAEDRWPGRIDLTIETRDPDPVMARMPVTDAARATSVSTFRSGESSPIQA